MLTRSRPSGRRVLIRRIPPDLAGSALILRPAFLVRVRGEMAVCRRDWRSVPAGSAVEASSGSGHAPVVLYMSLRPRTGTLFPLGETPTCHRHLQRKRYAEQ